MAKKRIFIAVPTSDKLQKEILTWEKKYLGSQPSFAKTSEGKIRWLAGKNLHITLIPPWYEEDIEKVKSKIEKVKAASFEIEFTKVIYGPDPKKPRLIWAEGKSSKRLLNLKDKLEKIFPEYKSAHKKWLMHMTIARFKPEEFSSFPVKKIDDEVLWRDKIKSLILMESHLSREGADYEVLQTIKLFSYPHTDIECR